MQKWAVVYHLVCQSGRPECRRAHYVGMASTLKPNQNPMPYRWSNHKSHHKAAKNLCQMTNHLITCHKNENPQDFVTITMLEACHDKFEAKERETIWAYNLFAFHPTGLNIREEVQFNLWKSISKLMRKFLKPTLNWKTKIPQTLPSQMCWSVLSNPFKKQHYSRKLCNLQVHHGDQGHLPPQHDQQDDLIQDYIVSGGLFLSVCQ